MKSSIGVLSTVAIAIAQDSTSERQFGPIPTDGPVAAALMSVNTIIGSILSTLSTLGPTEYPVTSVFESQVNEMDTLMQNAASHVEDVDHDELFTHTNSRTLSYLYMQIANMLSSFNSRALVFSDAGKAIDAKFFRGPIEDITGNFAELLVTVNSAGQENCDWLTKITGQSHLNVLIGLAAETFSASPVYFSDLKCQTSVTGTAAVIGTTPPAGSGSASSKRTSKDESSSDAAVLIDVAPWAAVAGVLLL